MPRRRRKSSNRFFYAFIDLGAPGDDIGSADADAYEKDPHNTMDVSGDGHVDIDADYPGTADEPCHMGDENGDVLGPMPTAYSGGVNNGVSRRLTGEFQYFFVCLFGLVFCEMSLVFIDFRLYQVCLFD